jgi:hypothetical protein
MAGLQLDLGPIFATLLPQLLPALKPVIKQIILDHLDEVLDAAFKAIEDVAAPHA